MYHDNLILQITSIVCLVAMCILLICSFIPWLEFEEEAEEYATAVRVAFIILILGLLRGAF